ncbi:MAG TPA: nucleoside monophosphate kinase [Bryobacteraceae bacterium]|nr:nucleoside monophosphate kinase [Bryobacteraceae bacterium]
MILLFGPPGCGKGTQSPLISKLLNVPAISTGEMLRAEVEAGTELGHQVQSLLQTGSLVSDELVNDIVVSRTSKPDCKNGFLLDGYPRTLTQAEFLDGHLVRLGFAPPTIFHLATPKSVLIERISSRRQCPKCGRIYNLLFKPPKKPNVCDDDGTRLIRRSDDSVEVVSARLEQYEKLTSPIMVHYAGGDYHSIPANRPPDEIYRDIEALLKVRMQRNSKPQRAPAAR